MSKIEWTGKTWNPVAGCKPISPGCANCYAEQMSGRCAAMGNAGYAGLTKRGTNGKTYLFTGDFRELPDRLDEPLRRKTPTTYFVNSMSDLFGEGVSNEYIAAVFGVMAACPQHTFQVLTKRAARMPEWFDWAQGYTVDYYGQTSPPLHPYVLLEMCMEREREDFAELLLRATNKLFRAGHVGPAPWPLPNVHLGVSVENRKHGLPRIDELRKVPAAIRFLSVEPLLEDLGEIDLTGIHWVIVGGESGTNARPMHPDWVRLIRDQCVAAGVPFFFKQWGEYADLTNAEDGDPRFRQSTCDEIFTSAGDILGAGYRHKRESGGMVEPDWKERGGAWMARIGKKAAGRILDGRTWDEVPK